MNLKSVLSVTSRIFSWCFKVVIICFCFWTFNKFTDLDRSISGLSSQNASLYDSTAYLYTTFSKTVFNIASILNHQNNKIVNIKKTQDQTASKIVEDFNSKLEAQEVFNAQVVGVVNNISDFLVESAVKPTYDVLKKHTVKIAQVDAGSEYGSVGTGVVFKVTDKETYILTNRHVCEFKEGSECFVYEGEEKYPITQVKACDLDYDIQLVKADIIPDKVQVPGIKTVVAQDRVFMVGNNRGHGDIYSEGTVSGFTRGDNSLLVGMPSGPGNSGSGIFTADGYLAGLLYAGQVYPIGKFDSLDSSHGICVRAEIIKLFVAEFFNE